MKLSYISTCTYVSTFKYTFVSTCTNFCWRTCTYTQVLQARSQGGFLGAEEPPSQIKGPQSYQKGPLLCLKKPQIC